MSTGALIFDDPPFFHESEGKMEAPLHGGLCRLSAQSGWSTGPTGGDSSPGVRIDLFFDRLPIEGIPENWHGKMLEDDQWWEGDKEGTVYRIGGVLGRSGARALHTLLGNFLEKHGA